MSSIEIPLTDLASTTSSTTFDIGQRTKNPPANIQTWFARHFCFMFIKFAFCVAFYTLQFQSHQIDHPPINPSLQEHLAEFRRESRTSKHEVILSNLRRARKLAEKEEENETYITETYVWTKPLDSQCAASDILDPFPDSFDPVYYKAQHEEDEEHYNTYGRENGLTCSRGQFMRQIIGTEILPLLPGNVLEIGPFINPMIRNTAGNQNNRVQYFDVANWDGLEQLANEYGYIVSPEPIDINFVESTGDLSIVSKHLEETNNQDNKYSMVVSSNVIGVQYDLVKHLQQVGNILQEGGYYTIVVPDKRFSHDHHAIETTIADVLDDYFGKNTKSKIRNLVFNKAMQVMNDPSKNWHGEYGFPYEDASDKDYLERIESAMKQYEKEQRQYNGSILVDVLQYHFTPHTLAFVVDTLYALGLTDLRVHRLYETIADKDEFNMVLKKCTPV